MGTGSLKAPWRTWGTESEAAGSLAPIQLNGVGVAVTVGVEAGLGLPVSHSPSLVDWLRSRA